MVTTGEETVVADAGQLGTGDVLASLLRAGQQVTADSLPAVVDEHVRRMGGERGLILLVDHGQGRLVAVGPAPGEPEALPVDGSPAGDAFRFSRPVATDTDLWLPLLAGAERLGVLGVGLGETGLAPDIDAFALLVAELVATRSVYSDRFFRLRRRERMSLEAELQWSLLPPLGARAGQTSLAGLLEPAYDVGGDAFDHAFDDGVLHLAVFDAVGHDVSASVVSHVVLGTYRHARRLGHDLATTAIVVDAAVADHLGDSLFATGVMAQLDCPTGELRWLGLGHPTPLLARRDQVLELTGRSSHPLGLGVGAAEPELVQLQPGDRVLFYTDGVVDSRIWDDEDDAIAWLSERLAEGAKADQPLEEILREMMLATVDRWQGRQRDDATLLLVEWQPG